MDREIGRLLDRLAARIDDGKTIVAFTADHGEEFTEQRSAPVTSTRSTRS